LLCHPINRYNLGGDRDLEKNQKGRPTKLDPTEGTLSDGQGGNQCPMLTQNRAERQVGFGRSLAP
jgi:hypothetical protein